VYDFLLVINSNLGYISHRYWDIATYWPKSQIIPTLSHLAPSFGVTFFEFMEKLYGSWNYRVFQFQATDGEDLVILACTVFDWSTRVTDGQTELRWLRRAKKRPHLSEVLLLIFCCRLFVVYFVFVYFSTVLLVLV